MAKTHEITRPSNSLKLSADKIVMLPFSRIKEVGAAMYKGQKL